jgi:hypothetical protein
MINLILFLAWTFANIQTTYISEADQKMDIKSIALLPVTDNVNSIYANPVENTIRLRLKENHHWEFVDTTSTGTILTPNELAENAAEITRVCENQKVNAVLASRVVKTNNNTNISMALFGCFDAKLLAREELNTTKFSNKDISTEASNALDKILNRIPFHGRVLSRNGSKVTLDLGSNDGVQPDEVVNIVQILEIERHPKDHFLIAAKKQVLGTVRLVKVDKTISFGVIETEATKNMISRGNKIDALRFVSYNNPNAYTLVAGDEMQSRPESKALYGDDATAWKPVSPPTMGAVALKLGLGTYDYNLSLNTENLKADSALYPSITIAGEVWLTTDWAVEASIRQGVMNVDNPLSGSSPGEIGITTTKLDLRGLYNFLLYQDFWGPKISVMFGFSNYLTKVDSSTPVGLTDTKYGGMHLGLRGTLPFGLRKEFTAGAELSFFLNADFSENPVDSGGSSDADITNFRFFGTYYLHQNLQITGDLEFEALKTDFSGAGSRTNGTASGSDQKNTILSVGAKYLW